MIDRIFVKRKYAFLLSAAMVSAMVTMLLPTRADAYEPQDFPAAKLVTWTSHRCLDVDSGTAGRPRTNVQLFNCRSNFDPLVGYQLFDRIPIAGRPSTEFKIKNIRTNKCLTYPVGGIESSPVWAEACSVAGQGWLRRDLRENVTQFIAVQSSNTSMCLDTVDLNGGLRTGIDLWTCSAAINSNRWIVN